MHYAVSQLGGWDGMMNQKQEVVKLRQGVRVLLSIY
jgi:hypothetical protein